MRNRIVTGAFLIGIVIFLSGCVETRILDELSITQGIGFDLADDGKIIGTVVIPVYLKDRPPENNVVSGKADLEKSIFQELQQTLATPITTGSLEILIFGEKLAKEKGILDLMDPFQRDPTIGRTMRLAVVEGEVKDFFEGDYGVRGNAYHINNLLKTGVENGNLPKTNFHRFLSDFKSIGKTPYIPILKKEKKDEIDLKGVGFFRYGKIVHQISMNESFFFKLLVDKHSHGWQVVNSDGKKASIQSIKSKHKFRLTKPTPPYEVTVEINLEGIINEYTGGEKISHKSIEKLEKAFEKKINEECLKLIEKFKELDIDPIGFGAFIKSADRKFDYKKWKDGGYKDLTVKIKANAEIQEVGIVE